VQKFDHNIGVWEKRQFFLQKMVKITEKCNHNIDPWSPHSWLYIFRKKCVHGIEIISCATFTQIFSLQSFSVFICVALAKMTRIGFRHNKNLQNWKSCRKKTFLLFTYFFAFTFVEVTCARIALLLQAIKGSKLPFLVNQ
jgi:hypothetical protein